MWTRRAVSLKELFLKTPKTGGSPGNFFADQDKNSSQEAHTKKKLGRDASVSEGVKGTSLGPGIGGSRNIKFSENPQTGGSPGDFFARQEDTSLSPPNSGKSPGEHVTRQGNNNQQQTTVGDHSTEDSLRFDRALQALGESTHPTKDKVFARKMAAYARPNNVASKCRTHYDSAPPLVAVKKGKADWLSDSAVRSALRLKKVGLTGLIASV